MIEHIRWHCCWREVETARALRIINRCLSVVVRGMGQGTVDAFATVSRLDVFKLVSEALAENTCVTTLILAGNLWSQTPWFILQKH